jgi:hypothetical protein
MSKPAKAKSKQLSEFEFLQGGQPPEGALKTHLAELKKSLGAEMKEKLAVRQKAAKYLSQISAPATAPPGAKAEQAISGLRALTDQLAKQRAAKPQKFFIPPITAWGQYTLLFTPDAYARSVLAPYSFGEVSETGNPTISATGNEVLGELLCSVETNYSSPSSGTASNLLGVVFKPIFNQATVRISFVSQLSFWWYVNSIQNKESVSEAQGLIELYEYDGAFIRPALRRGAFLGWSEVGFNSLDFDVVNEAGPTWTLEAPVTSSLWYFIVVSLSCSASGTGWPGGLAGANATVTVPSITATITADSVVLPEA